ncbi:hypothetical protein Tco_1067035 [Tanacetum coccineum]|uniref:Uncharacterized protein n=1 Tax=Tanacetum coccineum TaxID=301880 RepID=A0ABQ5HC28_9ASTR
MVPRPVLMKSSLVSVNTARQVNAAHSKTTVNAARQCGPDGYLILMAQTKTMNYDPIVAGTINTQTADPPYSQDPKSSHDDGSKPSSDDGKKVDEDPRKDSECCDRHEQVGLAGHLGSTNNVLIPLCMTRSSTKELFTSFKNPEQVFRSSRKLSKIRNLDYLNSPEFNLISDLEDQFEEEETEAMAETMKEYMTKTRDGYGLGIARPEIDDKAHFEIKGQFLKELRDNTFIGLDHEDTNEHIEKVLEIVDLFHIPEITQD